MDSLEVSVWSKDISVGIEVSAVKSDVVVDSMCLSTDGDVCEVSAVVCELSGEACWSVVNVNVATEENCGLTDVVIGCGSV